MRIDLHTHSSISDGTDTPAELIERASRKGLDVIALTDHDTFDGLDAAVAAGERLGVTVLRGLELSCSRFGQSVHLLGYGVDQQHPALAAELERVRGGRLGRLSGVLAKLEELGVPVTEADVLEQVGESPSVGRPHIADALVRRATSVIGPRPSTVSWPTGDRRTSPGTPSRSAAVSTWCVPPAAWL